MEKKFHILVVDDEPYVAQLVERALEGGGYSVTVASDGTSAISAASERKPDLVILDIKMPGLNGYQVLEKIRKSSNVPVLMLTAVRGESALTQSLNLGADDFIEKPFLPKILIARVQAKLRRVQGE